MFAAILILAVRAGVPQTVPLPDDVLIALERTSCLGTCPIYRVSIDAHGNVVYDGKQFVRVTGRQTDRVPISRVAEILEHADRLRFFDLKDRYLEIENPDGTKTTVTDLPTAFVTITRAGRSKRIEDYVGAPAALADLERLIDEVAHTRQWISLDRETLERLVQQGWRPDEKAKASLLINALNEDDVDVVKGLLELGANPNETSGDAVAPLLAARSGGAATALLLAGADPNARSDNGPTPLEQSAYYAPDLAAALLNAGARVDDLAGPGEITALWFAACSGNAGVVTLLLAAGANPAVRDADGKSALECAREVRQADRAQQPPPLPLDGPPAFTKDFDAVIAALEGALGASRR